ncbi:MAG: hypothetical protein ACOYOU_17760, partial [Kiritimatiellia bacterium]
MHKKQGTHHNWFGGVGKLWNDGVRAWSLPEASQLIQQPSRSVGSRQVAKVAKTNKFDVSACGETTSGKLGVLGVLAV